MVAKDSHDSDHYLIIIHINCLVKIVSVFSYKLKLSCAQWIQANIYLASAAPHIISSIIVAIYLSILLIDKLRPPPPPIAKTQSILLANRHP